VRPFLSFGAIDFKGGGHRSRGAPAAQRSLLAARFVRSRGARANSIDVTDYYEVTYHK